MNDQDRENNQVEKEKRPLYEIQLDYTSGEIWEDIRPGSYALAVTFLKGCAGSDLPVPSIHLMEVVQILAIAQNWISRREKKVLSPSYAELMVHW